MADGTAPDPEEQELVQHIEHNEQIAPAATPEPEEEEEQKAPEQQETTDDAQPEENDPEPVAEETTDDKNEAPKEKEDKQLLENTEKQNVQKKDNEEVVSDKDESDERKPLTPNEQVQTSKDVDTLVVATNNEPRKSALTDTEELYISHLLDCCDAGDGFDIFQLLAINLGKIGTIKNDELERRSKYLAWLFHFFNSVKGILTGATQVIGISIIMVDFIRSGLTDKYGSVDNAWDEGVCNKDHDEYDSGVDPEVVFYRFLLTCLAFLFSSFLAFFSMDHLLHIEKGMYKNLDYAKHLNWINSTWLRLGFLVNVLVSIISVYGSFVVIYFSDNALDMVLNSVALFFIVELDDLLVNPEDYQKIEKYLQTKKYKYMVMEAEARDESCFRNCCNNMVHCCGWFYLVPFQILRYVTIVLCVIFPFVVAYCY